MGRFRERVTGSVVSVADEADASLETFGYYERLDAPAKKAVAAPAKKAAAKKTAAKKSSK